MKVNLLVSSLTEHVSVIMENKRLQSQIFNDDFVSFVTAKSKVTANDVTASLAMITKKMGNREDRLVWVYRIYRLMLLSGLNMGSLSPEETKKVDKFLKEYNKKSKQSLTWDDIKKWPSLKKMMDVFEHFLSLKIHDIDSYKFEYQSLDDVVEDFKEYESDHVANVDEDDHYIQHDEDIKEFLDVGSGFKWFDLGKASCDKEAKAMGHCGNAPASRDTNQTVLSLRKRVMKGDRELWKPHLTFIFHKKEKSLGEMKGRANEKPSKKYHKYIVPLLLDQRIDAIHGGGYIAGSNFSIMDLDEKQRRTITEKKPNMKPFIMVVQDEGIDSPNVYTKLVKLMGEDNIKRNSVSGKISYVYEQSTLDDIIEDYGDHGLQWANKILSGEEYLDIDVDIFDVEDELNSHQIDTITEYVDVMYPDEIEEDADFRDYIEVLQANDEEIVDYYRYAREVGTQDEIYRRMMGAIREYDEDGIFTYINKEDVELRIELKTIYEYYVINDNDGSIGDFVEYIEEYSSSVQSPEINLDVPDYDFYEFDKTVFDGYMSPEINRMETEIQKHESE